MNNSAISEWVSDARQRTIDLVADIPDDKLFGPKIDIINPWLWEIGHICWFQEKWILRHAAGAEPVRRDGDSLWDSMAIPHDTRWDLPLPARKETIRYMTEVHDRVLERLTEGCQSKKDIYFMLLGVHHEDMHTEAFTQTRQTLGYPAPQFKGFASPRGDAPEKETEGTPEDVEFPGGGENSDSP